jgi:hypothetical protein
MACYRAARSFVKISLSPPFDDAQGMLFQRGVKLQQKTIPPLKKGSKGDLRADCARYHPSDFLNEL